MGKKLIAMVAVAILLVSCDSAREGKEDSYKQTAAESTAERPTAEQVFLYVEVIDSAFLTDKKEARSVLQSWLNGEPNTYKSAVSGETELGPETLQFEQVAVSSSVGPSCGTCLYGCCKNWVCNGSCVRRCIEGICKQP